MKRIFINGASRETGAATVEELAIELDPAPQTLLIELNQKALLRSEWPRAPIHDEDRIEILKISAGG